MVAGVSEGDSALVATGIAAAVAGSGHRAVLIDGSPEGDITESLGLRDRSGLREAVAGEEADPRSGLVAGPAGIRVLARGRGGAVELLAVDRARALLDGLLRDADLIVIDGGAMQHSAAALSWARAAQQTILLVRRGTSRRDDLRLAVESLRFVNANLGGAVLVQRSGGRSFRRSGARPGRAASGTPARAAAGPGAGWAPGAEPAADRFVPAPPDVLKAVGPQATPPIVMRTVSSSRSGTASSSDPAPVREADAFDRGASSSGEPAARWTPVDDTKPVRKRTPRTRRAD